ncbi:winged helix-turn-helix transcriptional regulator [Spirosoma sp. KUDC1026]|uniref:winged helix-turn-helix transcriptional regulator n=1 Tax=Spirosoma sp. KUDC1026 TaxID=2745947 RepID=UPI00159BD2C0|nr:helix-turn-helix domain-containing protein [Spirosoma sp. KUDC1026]QKZ14736.1 helix-turn-helix transcriptional regulator [Spirosoma sp. KUDC1026]
MILETIKCDTAQARQRTLALKDAIELLSGKWKFCILLNLHNLGPLRFKDLQETAIGITPKVLSKELQELEENLLITRTVNTTKPVTVSYALTAHAIEIQPVLEALINFGLKHRAKIKADNA